MHSLPGLSASPPSRRLIGSLFFISFCSRRQAEGWLPQAFWALHRLARCRRSLALYSAEERNNKDGGGGSGGGSGSYVSTVMRLAAVLKDPRVRSEGGKTAVENAAAALLRDARSFAAASARDDSPGQDSSPVSPEREPSFVVDSASDGVGGRAGGGGKEVYRLQCFAEVNLTVTDADDAVGGGSAEGQKKTKSKKINRRLDPFPAVHIGDPLYVSCVLTSHLPETVTLDSLALEMALDGGGGWNGQASTEASIRGGGGGERSSHKRASPKRNKILRRLESVRTVGGVGDSNNDPSPPDSPVSGSAASGSSKLFSSSAHGAAASQALLSPGTGDGDTMANSSGATSSGHGKVSASSFQVPRIRTARSQSVSPRTSLASSSAASAHDVKEEPPIVRVPSSKFSSNPGNRPPRSSLGAGAGRRGSRSPTRHSIGPSPVSSAPAAPARGLSRMHKISPRPTCSARIEGPVELLPGDTEVVFSLRPTVAGVITASRISAVWGGVTLVELLSGRGRGRGVASEASLPSAWVGVPRPPPSAVVRPFRPQAVLGIVPPSFLPVGNERWLRVTVAAGPDTLRGARLRVTAGHGLAWGSAGASRVKLRRQQERGADGAPGDGDDPSLKDAAPGVGEEPAQAREGEDSADMLVDLQGKVLRPGCVAEVFLRVRSTAEAAAAAGGHISFAPRPCALRVELQAWHSRHPAAAGDDATAEIEDDTRVEDWGVECRTGARAGVSPGLPFEATVTVKARQAGVVFAQAALVCTAPVALSLRSCELCQLEPGAEVLSDPNSFLDGEVLPPGQPLRLATCLRQRRLAEAEVAVDDDGKSGDASSPYLAVHRLTYSIEGAAACDGDGGGGGGDRNGNSGVHASELFVFDVCMPRPLGVTGHASAGSSSRASVAGSASVQRSLVTTVRPCDGSEPGSADGSADVGAAVGNDDDVLHLKLAETRAFEFGVADGDGSSGHQDNTAVAAGGQSVMYQVVASPSDWMVSGLIRGTAKLKLKVCVCVCACLFLLVRAFFIMIDQNKQRHQVDRSR